MTVTPAEARAELERRAMRPKDWRKWLREMFPKHTGYSFAGHQVEFWDWVWTIQLGVDADPFIGIWPRSGGKSTNAEMAVAALGARDERKYCVYVCETQDQANDHVDAIGEMLTSQRQYPALATPKVSVVGTRAGWRRNRLITSSGFIVDALGLEVQKRGAKIEEQRPDLFVFDDIDHPEDSKSTTDKKRLRITNDLLPAGVIEGLAVIAIQNLIKEDGIFAELAIREDTEDLKAADYLGTRIISGPVPALEGLTHEGNKITGGTPTWEGQSLEHCQALVDKRFGITTFLAECQHDVGVPDGGMFSHLDFRYEDFSDELLRSFDRVVCWVDPAVTDTDKSDANGIQVAGIRGQVKYMLWSWERRSSSGETLRMAARKAIEYGAQHVGVETDQGGDLWEDAYKQACLAEGVPLSKAPAYTSEKAGAGFGSKQHRAQLMLTDYERGRIVHVRGTHETLERSLKRFPIKKPYDLVDAEFWAWNDLNDGPQDGFRVPDPTRSRKKPGQDMYPREPGNLTPEEKRKLLRIRKEGSSLEATRKMIEKL